MKLSKTTSALCTAMLLLAGGCKSKQPPEAAPVQTGPTAASAPVARPQKQPISVLHDDTGKIVADDVVSTHFHHRDVLTWSTGEPQTKFMIHFDKPFCDDGSGSLSQDLSGSTTVPVSCTIGVNPQTITGYKYHVSDLTPKQQRHKHHLLTAHCNGCTVTVDPDS